MNNLGTKIEHIAKPIARGIDAIWGSDLAGCSGCSKMRDNLNAGMSVQDAIYERWFKAKQEGEKMKYQATVVIDAEKMSEAVAKAESAGEVISIQVKPVAVQRPPGVPGQGGMTGRTGQTG